jgi:hypothetical protein
VIALFCLSPISQGGKELLILSLLMSNVLFQTSCSNEFLDHDSFDFAVKV